MRTQSRASGSSSTIRARTRSSADMIVLPRCGTEREADPRASPAPVPVLQYQRGGRSVEAVEPCPGVREADPLAPVRAQTDPGVLDGEHQRLALPSNLHLHAALPRLLRDPVAD